MTILETPKEKPKRDLSRAFDLWLSKYPAIEPVKIGEEEWLFGRMQKNGKMVSLFNFSMMPENLAHYDETGWFQFEFARNIDAEIFLDTISQAKLFSVPLVHFLYFPKTDTLVFQTIWKDGFKTEVLFREDKKYNHGLAKVYFTDPHIIEGSDD